MEKLEFNSNADTFPDALNVREIRALELCEMMDGIYDACAGNEGAYMAEVLSLAKTPAEVFLIGVYAGKASLLDNNKITRQNSVIEEFSGVPLIATMGIT